jgi:transposase-like protein
MLMATRKRHSSAEIAAKLAIASLLTKEGKRQSEIARALGISVMTFHRWRKAQIPNDSIPSAQTPAMQPGLDPNQLNQMARLELENSRLRRLVTDLLLKKIECEETSKRAARHDD